MICIFYININNNNNKKVYTTEWNKIKNTITCIITVFVISYLWLVNIARILNYKFNWKVLLLSCFNSVHCTYMQYNID
jgi:hypothetical protein